MMGVRIKKTGLFLTGLMSYAGVFSLMLLILQPTKSEPDTQDLWFVYISGWLCLSALLTTAVSAKAIRFVWQDLIVATGAAYVLWNYNFVSDAYSSEGIMGLACCLVAYVSLRVIFSAYGNMALFAFVTIIFFGFIEGLTGILQAFGREYSLHHLYKVSGTFFNPGPYGGFLAVVMAMSTSFLIRSDFLSETFKLSALADLWFKPRRYLYSAIYVLCFATLICCLFVFVAVMSRAAIISYALCLGIMVLFGRNPISRKVRRLFAGRKKYIMLVAVAAVCVGAGVVLYNVKPGSASGRMLIWNVSADVIAENPLCGVGYGEFFAAYADKQAAFFDDSGNAGYVDVADVPEYGFNEYLYAGAQTGLVGLGLMLLLFGLSLYRLFRRRSPFAYGLLSVMIFAFFSYPFSVLPIVIVTLVSVCAGASVACIVKEGGSVSNRFLAGWGLGLLFVAYLFAVPSYKGRLEAYKEWNLCKYLYNSEWYSEAVKDYSALYPLLCDNPKFMFEFGRALNKDGQYGRSNAVLSEGARYSADPMFYNVMGNNYKEMGDSVAAEACYNYASRILPNRMYPLFLLLKLYSDTDQREKALAAAEELMAFRPKIESTATKDMRAEAREIMDSLKAGSPTFQGGM